MVLATLALIGAVLYSGYLRYTNIDPEPIAVEPQDLVVDETGRRVSYGDSYIDRRGKLWVMHLQGSPAQLGDAHGHLTARLFRRLDERVAELAGTRFGGVEGWAEGLILRWDYRDTDPALRLEERQELTTLGAALPDPDDRKLGNYHRLFLYQCFFDLSQRLADATVAGSMFSVTAGTRSEPGNVVVGRTLTVDLGRDFTPDRVVSLVYPDGRYPYAAVGWPGLIGVVTGVNARGIVVAINPARTDDPKQDGRSLPSLAREILERADTLEQALEILQENPVRTAGIVLLADGVQRTSVVAEITSSPSEERRVIVRGLEDDIVMATDHMLDESFERDAQNERIARTTSSSYRLERMQELVTDGMEFTVDDALAVLRDRRGHDGAELGLGNRYALENLVTTQSVIIDATSMVLWVAEGPSTLGRYRAFDLRTLLGRQGRSPAPLDDLPADRLLYSEEYNDYQEALAELEHARRLLKEDRADDALVSGKVALALAPDVADLHRLLGDIHRELDEDEPAIRHYRRYLELVPGRARDQEVVRGILDELGG